MVLRSPKLSVVVPCHNEVENIAELVKQVFEVCQKHAPDFELILVDDGSEDKTWSMIEAEASSKPQIVGVKLSRNHGHQIALTAGLSHAKGQRIMMMDADLQDPPQLLPEMMMGLDSGADVAYGLRRTRDGETVFKKITAKYFYKLINYLSSGQIPRDTGDFRLVTRRALDTFLSMNEQFRFVRGMFSWIGFNQVPIEYDRNPRLAGETKYTFSKMLIFAIDAITSFSTLPIRFAVYLSLFSLFVAFGATIYVFISFFSAAPVPGWASTLLMLSFFSGTQLLALGIIGEYVGRMSVELKKRPMFIVDQVVNK